MANVRLPVLNDRETGSITNDGHRRRIVPADVHGRFTSARTAVYAALVLLWAALPWVRVNGAPAVFLDFEARKFFLFGATFNAQDTWLGFFLLSGVGFGLVYATTLAGRAWCGWACPQTVFLEGLYRRVERWIEGPRERRLRRDAGPLTTGRAARKVMKHASFAVLSLAIAHVVLSYFVSLPRAFAMMRQSPANHPEAFAWVTGIALLLYGNFAWFREQLCVVLCPYGRLQSVLLDDDSLVVGYDVKRGEPRGKATKTGAGDCVDCKRCVAVCPTGIDIRDGLQLDCVACTACIDACDDVMVRLGRPRGLVRYDSLNGLAGKARRIVRPRLVLYTALLALGGVVASIALRSHTDFEAVLLRLQGAPYTLEGDDIQNAFQLHLVNKRSGAESFDVLVNAPRGSHAVVPLAHVTLDSLADARLPVFLTMPRGTFQGDTPFEIRISRTGANDAVVVRGTFLGTTQPR